MSDPLRGRGGRHAHTSPFEQVVMTFHLKMPIFVARQWMRHRTVRANEISGRYSEYASMIEDMLARELAYQAFEEHLLHGGHRSRIELFDKLGLSDPDLAG